MRRSGIVCAALLLAGLAAPAALAGSEKGDWVLRFGGQTVDPSGEFESTEKKSEDGIRLTPRDFGVVETSGQTRFSGESGFGFFASLEYRWTDLVGIEVALSEESADLSGRSILEQVATTDRGVIVLERKKTERFDGTIDVRPISLGINVHHDFGFMELTIGALASYVMFDGFEIDGVEYNVDDGFGWGWQAGFDFPLGAESKWFVAFSVRYIKITADVEITEFPAFEEDFLDRPIESEGFRDNTYNHDPYVVRLGAGYRF